MKHNLYPSGSTPDDPLTYKDLSSDHVARVKVTIADCFNSVSRVARHSEDFSSVMR